MERLVAYLFSVLLILVVSFLAGCVPHVGRTIAAPNLSLTEQQSLPNVLGGSPLVYISNVIDVRPVEQGPFNGVKTVRPDTDEAIEQLRSVLEQQFRAAGCEFNVKAPFALNISIAKWNAEIRKKLNSSIHGLALLDVQVSDQRNVQVYRSAYRGVAEISNPILNHDNLEQILARSMQVALGQMFRDKHLLELLKNS